MSDKVTCSQGVDSEQHRRRTAKYVEGYGSWCLTCWSRAGKPRDMWVGFSDFYRAVVW